MPYEESVPEVIIANLREAARRIKATQNPMRSQALARDQNHRY
jgi:hypothetical protein